MAPSSVGVFSKSQGLVRSSAVPGYVIGPAVRVGATGKQAVSHYSVLATIEAAWGLPRLGASAQAAPIRGIWRGGK